MRARRSWTRVIVAACLIGCSSETIVPPAPSTPTLPGASSIRSDVDGVIAALGAACPTRTSLPTDTGLRNAGMAATALLNHVADHLATAQPPADAAGAAGDFASDVLARTHAMRAGVADCAEVRALVATGRTIAVQLRGTIPP